MGRLDEYNTLRNEILKSFDITSHIQISMYTVVGGILAFALQQKLPLVCLVPFIVIIPSVYKIRSIKYGNLKISTYIQIFIEKEDENLNWETLNYQYYQRRKTKKSKTFYFLHNSSFLLISLFCIVAFLGLSIEQKLWVIQIQIFILGIVLSIFFIILIILVQVDIQKAYVYCDEYLKLWKDIKNKYIE